MPKKKNYKVSVKTDKYKSRLERSFAEKFPECQYEKDKIQYTLVRKYNPDWKYKDGLYFETKGLFDAEDRQKHLAIKEQHPEVEIIFIFENADKKIHKMSSTTYADWCKKNDFKWHDWRKIKDENINIEGLIKNAN